MELFNDQNFDKIRKKYEELGVPWTDPTFTSSDSSIGQSKLKDLPRNIQWKRPYEITKDPKLFVDGASSRDTTQGKIGNCWFVAACSVLAGSKEVWKKVIPDWEDQVLDPESQTLNHLNQKAEYSGVIRFRFWRFGKWVEVLVDDLLPTFVNNADKIELVFSHSSSHTEFWGALLEKAYAKLHGCYAVLDGGNLSDALVDFTSGISEVIDFDAKSSALRSPESPEKKDLFKMMTDDIVDHALMCAAIKANTSEEMETRTDLGLVKGHAYGITAVKRIPLGGTSLTTLFTGREKLALVRLQNPWGQKEWSGPFSDTFWIGFTGTITALT